MSVPVLLITGALGAGKTTLINRLLSEPGGRRLAAVVNDFGAIDIDAALLADVSDDVVSLKNGCICCSLQADLLSTLSQLVRRVPVLDGIVIETSGVSNPADIIRCLMDPVIWKAAPLDAVLTVVDARMLVDEPACMDDALWRAQLQASDFVVLSKSDLLDPAEQRQALAALRSRKPEHLIHEADNGGVPAELLFSSALHSPDTFRPLRTDGTLPQFQTVSWTSPSPLSIDSFQALVARFSPALVRAKGLVLFRERPQELTLFQLVGTRAALSPAPAQAQGDRASRIVFIARAGALAEEHLVRCLDACRSAPLADRQPAHADQPQP